MHTLSPPLVQPSLQQKRRAAQMKDVATIILGGGQGSRLLPLTMSRCKPALCYGGRYRLIDIPISNTIHSGCKQIFVITQFLSRSLHQHILATYRFGSSSTFIELLSTEEKPKNKVWFQGTADAVRQNLDYFEDTHAEYFLILSGDQLYHMDFNALLDCARETDADMMVASLPVDAAHAKRMGIMKINENHFIEDFHEKPQKQEELDKLRFSSGAPHQKTSDLYLGSMGIYLFKRKALIDILRKDNREDFGKHLIPTLVGEGKVAAYIHHGYWEDIGTVESFYAVNMALTKSTTPFDCYREDWPIFSRPTTLPGAKVLGAVVDHSLLCEGTVIENATIKGSIIGPRTHVRSGTTICHTYVMGNDFFTPPANTRLPEKLHIGKNSIIERAIIDRHVCIGDHVQLVNKQNLVSYDSDHVYIRDGIIIVPHGASIPDGFVL
jgi:glucose-1-phosphate adenylyltransferase